MQLYDTLTRSVLPVVPLDTRTLRFYCCGPTVYGQAHIGNFRTFVLQDVFRRTLEIGGLKTRHVRNITDVDDKTIKGAIESGKPLQEFTAYWTELFHEDCKALNLLAPHHEPAATAHIEQQIELIQKLIKKGHAYPSEDGSVYFKISSYPEYGRLSQLQKRELKLGHTQNQRADSDEYEKDSLADFVLWKAYREEDGDNKWSSPWGEGRPGWHLECSAMCEHYLGADFDVHSGGCDLTFPHHENEIAQSICSHGGGFARHWFHTAHLKVNGQKMSKSLGNLYTLQNLGEKGITPNQVRYELLSGHYRKPLNFTFDSLHAKQEALQKLAHAEYDLRLSLGNPEALCYEELLGLEDFGLLKPAWDMLNRDLNTAATLGQTFSALRHLQTEGDAKTNWRGLHAILYALGLKLPEIVTAEELQKEAPKEVQELAERRLQARKEKDWSLADTLRQEITEQGWAVMDTPEGFELQEV